MSDMHTLSAPDPAPAPGFGGAQPPVNVSTSPTLSVACFPSGAAGNYVESCDIAPNCTMLLVVEDCTAVCTSGDTPAAQVQRFIQTAGVSARVFSRCGQYQLNHDVMHRCSLQTAARVLWWLANVVRTRASAVHTVKQLMCDAVQV